MLVVLALTLSVATAPDELARLTSGEVLSSTRTVPGSEVPETTVRAVIDAPPEKVWAIVSDCGSYKRTMPNIAESKEVSTTPGNEQGEGSVHVCRVVADMPFPFQDLVSVNRAVHTVQPGKRWQRVWKLVEGDYELNQGTWQLEPFGVDGKKTLATYILAAKPKIPLPSAMVTTISSSKLPAMMRHLREQLHARSAP